MADLDLEPSDGTPAINGVNGFPPQLKTNGSTSVESFEIEQYLSSLLGVTLGASKHDLEATNSLLSSQSAPETIDRCRGFLQSSRLALYALKLGGEHKENGDSETDSGTHNHPFKLY